MIHNIISDPDIINATANVTATASGVGFTGAEMDMLTIGAGSLLLMFVAMAMD